MRWEESLAGLERASNHTTPASPPPAISVRSVSKRYGARTALADVSFEVAIGEVFALLGPNGAGKTTTVEILEGFRAPTGGAVEVLGFDPSTQPLGLRQRVGVVLQECGFPSHLRVGELVDAWRAYYDHPRPQGELLEVVELSEQHDVLVNQLSGGQRRRLDLALALAGDPDLVFLDEPTTGFDPEARRRCWTAIENLAALDKTVVLTTHYLDEAEHLADRVAILAGGVIRALGTPSELSRQAGIPTRISFRVASPRSIRPLPPSVREVTRDGDGFAMASPEPVTTIRSLLAWASRHRVALTDLRVEPPNLEDAYLVLVGNDPSGKP